MKNILLLLSTSFAIFNIQAQTVHNAKVLGNISIGNEEVSSIYDEYNGKNYKTASHKKGDLIINESIQLKFNSLDESQGEVVKSSINKLIIAYRETPPGETFPYTFLNKPRVRLRHKIVSPDGVKSNCNYPRGTCLVVTFRTAVDGDGTPIKPLKEDEGTATMTLRSLTEMINEETNTPYYTGQFSFIYDQPTALEDGTNPVLENVLLDHELAFDLGFDEVTVLANNYVVDFSKHQFGEIVYDFIATGKLKAKIRTDVSSNSSTNPLSVCNICPQDFKIVNSETTHPPLQNFGTAEIKVIGNKLHLVFDQPTANQDGNIVITEDFSIGKNASEFIKYNDVILSKGVYPVKFSNTPFGEVLIPIKAVQ